MKIKTSEATPPQLDWLVGKCEEATDRRITLIRHEAYTGYPVEREVEFDSAPNFERWSPSRIWAQAGPIIEREAINVYATPLGWDSCRDSDMLNFTKTFNGPTPLIAAMRCYVASKMGDEVEIPEELL
jgi:hypothetical protein